MARAQYHYAIVDRTRVRTLVARERVPIDLSTLACAVNPFKWENGVPNSKLVPRLHQIDRKLHSTS